MNRRMQESINNIVPTSLLIRTSWYELYLITIAQVEQQPRAITPACNVGAKAYVVPTDTLLSLTTVDQKPRSYGPMPLWDDDGA